MTVAEDVFWFADLTDDEDLQAKGYYQAFIQIDACCFPIAGICFLTKEQCEDWVQSMLDRVDRTVRKEK